MPRDRRAPARGRLVPPSPSRADFHAHTSRSDGLLAPIDLVSAAAAAGVRTLALTDHDTLAGYRELVAPGASPLPAGFDLVPGVEINATVSDAADLPDGELHLIGLGVDPGAEAFEAVLDRQRGARRRRFERMLAKLREAGLPVDAQLEDLDRSDDESLGRPTIARALVRAGFAGDVQDAFDRIVGHGRPGYVRREALGPVDALAAIRRAGGLPILAHFASAPDRPALLRDLVDAGLAGIEVHHRSFDAGTVERMRDVAAAHRLVPSGGTDFHGDEGSYAEAIAETWIPDEVADEVRMALGLLSRAAR
jgi:hypothetical protein